MSASISFRELDGSGKVFCENGMVSMADCGTYADGAAARRETAIGE